MVGILASDEIESMLRRHRVGRLGCTSNDRPYVVPINYVFDGAHIYGYSVLGRKIDLMREQPLVSFEIDEVDGPSNWRSVIVEGVYEELQDDLGQRAAKRLLATGIGSVVSRGLNANPAVVFFRIQPTEISGRFERWDA